jgi:hypothetical protein
MPCRRHARVPDEERPAWIAPGGPFRVDAAEGGGGGVLGGTVVQ